MVVINSAFTDKSVRKLNNFTVKRQLPLFIIMSAFFILLGIAGFGLKLSTYFGIIFITMGILYIPILYLLTQVGVKSQIKSMRLLSYQHIERWTFDEQMITIEVYKNGELSGKSSNTYSEYYSAWIDKDTLYLYISKAQAHIIDLSGIEWGDINELKQLLSLQFGSKNFHFKG